VIVDVAVDQGGCIETIRATTHDAPTYVVDGVVHYGVANMPGAVPNTSTRALSNQTLPFALRLAAEGRRALEREGPLQRGLNTHAGRLSCQGVAEAFALPFVPAATALAA
jgi:alanine dehydrogenase